MMTKVWTGCGAAVLLGALVAAQGLSSVAPFRAEANYVRVDV